MFSIGAFLYLVLSFTWTNQSIFLYPFFENEQNFIILSSQIEIVLNLIGILYLIIKFKNFENLKIVFKKMENYFDVKNIFIETKIKNIPKLIFKILSEILKTKLPPITDPVIPKIPT